MTLQQAGCAGQCLDHQAVPADQHFVILAGMNTLAADLQQFAARFGQLASDVRSINMPLSGYLFDISRHMQNVLSLEIARGSHSIHVTEQASCLPTEMLHDLVSCPDVVLSLFSFAVGVFRAVKASFGSVMSRKM